LLKQELENAMKSKSFEECDNIQNRIDELMIKQSKLPSVDSLRAAVIAAEVTVSQAAQKRDFQGAAEAQTVLDKAKHQLSEALADNEEFFDALDFCSDVDFKENRMSRSQLEAEIADIWSQITDAISGQNFNKANTLQKILEEKESLKLQFPSTEELEGQISKTKTEIEECTSKKDFIKANQLNDALVALEKKLKEEENMERIMKDSRKPSKSLSFESRSKLEEEISVLSAMVSKSVAARDFKKADQLQTDLENLTKLRDICPTLSNLKQQLRSKKAELEEAVLHKQFSRADSLQCSIKEIEQMIATEQNFMSPISKAPTQQNSVMGAKVALAATGNVAKATPNASSDDSISISKTPVSVTSGASVNSTKFQNSVSSVSAPKISMKTRPVSKLRPTAPLVCETSNTILSVTKMLANKRGNACVVVNESGTLEGILTDTDITRRVVAKFVDSSSTAVSDVMTHNPTCVSMTDSALDALMTMVENHFRHLPVVDAEGSVVGLLDIAKCLDDAISNLERKQHKSSKTAESVVKQVVSQQGNIGASAAQLEALITSVLSQAFAGQAMPTLRGVLAGKPKTLVSPDSTIQDAGILMAQDRKAALIVDNGALVGVFTFKDMMTRAVAKELAITSVPVSDVMTPSPEAVSPDITVLEALQIMHDNRFLTLPVCEDDGTVVGLVDVMDAIYGCGGSSGWRSIFNEAMDVQDDMSDTGSRSCNSGSEKLSMGLTRNTQIEGDTASITSRKSDQLSARNHPKVDKSVAKLRPVAPCLSGSDDSILSVVQLLKSKRGSACLVVSGSGALAGILTDTDVTRRVVAKYVDPAFTHVSQVMTKDPTCVSLSDSATDALAIMVENHFRHLPVVDELGSVVGLLDIAKCLNDAISKLERVQETSHVAAENAVHQAILSRGGDMSQVEALQSVLGNLIAQAFGGRSTPTLRSVLAGKPSTIVDPETSIRDTGIVMANVRKAALIVENGELVGIFSFKDCMYRAVAMELPLETTPVREVMTPCPESVSPDITVLEALQVMHDHRFLSLPVCEQNGAVVGLVDVMDVIYGCGGADGWRSIFNSAMDIDDGSVVGSMHTNPKPATPVFRPFEANNSPISTPHIKLNVPTTLEFVDRDDQNSFAGSIGVSKLMSPDDLDESMIGSISNVVVFKVFCTSSGASHRIRCEPRLSDLVAAIAAKTEIPSDRIQIEYEDDEGDSVRITSDDDVIEAYNMARRAGLKLAKLTVSEESIFKSVQIPSFGIEVAAAAVLGTLALLWMRRR
jgi:CBS domain-containing protein